MTNSFCVRDPSCITAFELVTRPMAISQNCLCISTGDFLSPVRGLGEMTIFNLHVLGLFVVNTSSSDEVDVWILNGLCISNRLVLGGRSVL